MDEITSTLAVLSNDSQAMVVSFDGWNGRPPAVLNLRPSTRGMAVMDESGRFRGTAPAGSAATLRGAGEIYAASITGGSLVEHGPVEIRWLLPDVN